jgi:thiamine-monophosphate kinase
MKEFEIINNLIRPLANNQSSQNLDDDVAVINLKTLAEEKQSLVISKDMLIENVHFRIQDGAKSIAHKMLAVNLSDLAATGAVPLFYLFGFGKSKNISSQFLKDFFESLDQLQKKYNCQLIGGDIVKSNKLALSVTIIGKVNNGANLKTNNAKFGDDIWVSGEIGNSYLGLQIINSKLKKNKEILQNSTKLDTKSRLLIESYLYPQPQIKLGSILANNNLAHATTDISDGLLADLAKIANKSRLTAKIFLEKIPHCQEFVTNITNGKKEYQKLITKIIAGGDDYQLIFTASKAKEEEINNIAKKNNIKLTKIGSFTEWQGRELEIIDWEQKQIIINKYGYQH